MRLTKNGLALLPALLPTLLPALLPLGSMAQSRIPISVDAYQTYTNTLGRKLNSVTLTSSVNGTQRLIVDDSRVYNDCTARTFYARPGETVNVSFGYSKDWMNGYVYIDIDGDGSLNAAVGTDGIPTEGSELMSYSFYSGNDTDDANGCNSKGETLKDKARNVLNPPGFKVPGSLAEGNYTIRFKVDWNSIDPAGDSNKVNGDFMENGGAIVDATLCVMKKTGPGTPLLHFESNYGFFVGAGQETGLPDVVPATDLKVKLISPAACYTAPKEISVWTVDADGVASEPANVKEESDGTFLIPTRTMTGGDVWVKALFKEPARYKSTDLQIAFSDEFTGRDKSQPDRKKWERAAHNNNSAWNRYVSTSNKVVYLQDGTLVTRCIPCAEEDKADNENRDWMSGAVDTRGLYSFRYGRVDVRALTNPFTGSFPAIWLLPDDQSAGWPQYGEIDIWEMVNTSNKAHGTIHAARESQYTKNTDCNYDGLYHVYSFEWTASQMKWSIDGKEAYSTLDKSIYNASQISQGYWPFNKKYYLILNQSVGMGGWAAYPVEGHKYETRFDFVRIYQTTQQNPTVGLAPAIWTADGPGSSSLKDNEGCFDLQGRSMAEKEDLTRGLYISNGSKRLKK